jgi:creatinine amidohydrolase
MVEDWVRHDDRCALPLGSTEQHAGIVATDAILAERVAAEAAEPLGVPVFPALPWTDPMLHRLSRHRRTYAAVIRDVLDSLKCAGFRRVLIVNAHEATRRRIGRAGMDDGQPDAQASTVASPLTARGAGDRSVASHASWMENFPDAPAEPPAAGGIKRMVDTERLRAMTPSTESLAAATSATMPKC